MTTRLALLALAGDLRIELAAMNRIAGEAALCVAEFAAREPSALELRGAGDVVHDFYNSVERFFERVAIELNGGLPGGADSHTRLLDRMARELPDVRPPVLRDETRRRLGEYLRFRHLFRHRYGFELQWTKLAPLLARMGSVAPAVREDFEAFIAFVGELAARLE